MAHPEHAERQQDQGESVQAEKSAQLAGVPEVVRLYQQTHSQYLRVMERANAYIQNHAEMVGLVVPNTSK